MQRELNENFPDLSVTVSEGGKGEFTVNEIFDGVASIILFDKSTTERFPDPGEVTQLLRNSIRNSIP